MWRGCVWVRRGEGRGRVGGRERGRRECVGSRERVYVRIKL